MNKIISTVLLASLMCTAAFAQSSTIVGTYMGSECGDYCWMSFKTSKGIVGLIGEPEDFKNISIKEGKTYTVTYKKETSPNPDHGNAEFDVITSIK